MSPPAPGLPSGSGILSGWLAVCGLKQEAKIWGGPAAVGGGDSRALDTALERAIAAGRPRGLVSFGLAGALEPRLAVGKAVVGAEVVMGERRWPCDPDTAAALASRFDTRLRTVVGSDRVIATAAAKQALARQGAVVDMESHVAARVAGRHDLPLVVLRVVSDGAGDILPPAAVAGFRADGGIDVGAVLLALARDPRQLPGLMKMGKNSGVAFRRLREVVGRLG